MEKRLELIETLRREVDKIGCRHELEKETGVVSSMIFHKMEGNIHNPETFWKYVETVSRVISEKAKIKQFVVNFKINGETVRQTRNGYECLRSFISTIDNPKGMMATEYGLNLDNVKIENSGGKIIKVEKDERGRIVIID